MRAVIGRPDEPEEVTVDPERPRAFVSVSYATDEVSVRFAVDLTVHDVHVGAGP